jgi:hypothetical protein
VSCRRRAGPILQVAAAEGIVMEGAQVRNALTASHY